MTAGTGVAAAPVLRAVDLHMHSTASDGARSPEEVAAAAHAAGLAAIALTDHDTVDGVAACREAGERLGVRVITGVELSAEDDGREVHLLGLHLARLGTIERAMAAFRETRIARARTMVERLNTLGVPVTFDQVLAQSGAGAVGRPHVARAVIDGGWAADAREVFDRYLGQGRPANVPKHRLDIGDAIRLVHDSGGLAIVAHPGPELNRVRIERLVGLGLDGLEVRHPSQNADETRRLAGLVEFFGLVPSGGSDWHGAPDGARAIGCMQVPCEVLERQEARLAGRDARAHA